MAIVTTQNKIEKLIKEIEKLKKRIKKLEYRESAKHKSF